MKTKRAHWICGLVVGLTQIVLSANSMYTQSRRAMENLVLMLNGPTFNEPAILTSNVDSMFRAAIPGIFILVMGVMIFTISLVFLMLPHHFKVKEVDATPPPPATS